MKRVLLASTAMLAFAGCATTGSGPEANTKAIEASANAVAAELEAAAAKASIAPVPVPDNILLAD